MRVGKISFVPPFFKDILVGFLNLAERVFAVGWHEVVVVGTFLGKLVGLLISFDVSVGSDPDEFPRQVFL